MEQPESASIFAGRVEDMRGRLESDHDVEIECPFCCHTFEVKHYHSIGDLIYHKECENHSVLIKATNPLHVAGRYILIKERRVNER